MFFLRQVAFNLHLHTAPVYPSVLFIMQVCRIGPPLNHGLQCYKKLNQTNNVPITYSSGCLTIKATHTHVWLFLASCHSENLKTSLGQLQACCFDLLFQSVKTSHNNKTSVCSRVSKSAIHYSPVCSGRFHSVTGGGEQGEGNRGAGLLFMSEKVCTVEAHVSAT